MVHMMTNDDTESGDINDFINRDVVEAIRVDSKPPIDHLRDAIGHRTNGDPIMLADVGDRIIVERVASVLVGRPWLDTKTYRIQRINDVTGELILMNTDEAFAQTSTSNYITGPARGYRFKLPDPKGFAIGKRKRGRPRKNPALVPAAKPVELDDNGIAVKKKRGRPAGTKNRAKDVVKAEKKAKLQKRAAKKLARAQQ